MLYAGWEVSQFEIYEPPFPTFFKARAWKRSEEELSPSSCTNSSACSADIPVSTAKPFATCACLLGLGLVSDNVLAPV